MTDSPEPTGRKQGGAPPFPPGVSGNPAGRPKGSRNKLSEAFLTDFLADWSDHGIAVIARVREEKPADYLKVAASLLPKEIHIKEDPFAGFSDDDLADALASVRALRGAGAEAGEGASSEDEPQPAQGLPAVH